MLVNGIIFGLVAIVVIACLVGLFSTRQVNGATRRPNCGVCKRGARWLYENVDGTPDRRYNKNAIYCQHCIDAQKGARA